MTNGEISDIFSLLAKLMDIHGENSFKTKSYANAAFTIDKLPAQLSDTPRGHIASIKGIGESTAKKIIELLDTAELKALNDLINKTPEGILELLSIKGIGPKKIATIWHELHIESPGELLYACNENRLIHFKGFGEKSQQSIKEALEFYFSNQKRFLYAQIEPLVQELQTQLGFLFGEENCFVSGAFKRQCDIIEEIDIVLLADLSSSKSKITAINHLELIDESEDSLHYTFQGVIPLNIYFSDKLHLGNKLFQYHSTIDFLTGFQKLYPEIDYHEKAYSEESHLFEQAALPYLPPFAREHPEIFSIAQQIDFKAILCDKDIKGVVHNHSIWSDGKNTIEEMARACMDKGYEYLVMSDHSVSSFYAKGLTVERIKMQHDEIDELNRKLTPFKIFKSIECDILNDGRLDYDDAVLESFDLVIVSIHQNLKMTEEKAMQRLLSAVSNPYTTILGHPTGRLLLSRKEYPISHEVLIEACRKHNVVIEINANPRRLDLDWRWIPAAMKAGVMMSVNPDAHSLKGIEDIRYGVLAAQKGLLSSAFNMSSLSRNEFEKYISAKKNKATGAKP